METNQLLAKAINLAMQAHAGQTDKAGMPSIRVALLFFKILPADFTKQDAVKQAEVLGIGLNTLNKWLDKFVQSNDILHVAHGVYQKRIA
jgi:hypothetical protein